MAIELDMLNPGDRKSLIGQILSTENQGRRATSLRQVEIFNDRLHQHVYERLRRRFSQTTVGQMPIISTINLARRIVIQEASIYRDPPKREFSELSDDQEETVRLIYKDMATDKKLAFANQSYKLQGDQTHLMILPKDGHLKLRVLRNHHLDKVDDDSDPELAAGYVISTFDKDNFIENRRQDTNSVTGFRGRFDNYSDQNSDRVDQSIGDQEDFKKSINRVVVWTPEYNFVMNKDGAIISGEQIDTAIPGSLPIIDISNEKDFEYWRRQGEALMDFTVEYNSLLSDVNQIVMMQGYAQAYLIGKDDISVDNFQIGPNFIVKLPFETGDERPEFGFAQPGANIEGAIKFTEVALANFLSSRGLDPKLISGVAESQRFSSGTERLLSMIEKFEATKSDFNVFKFAEKRLYKLVKEWHNNLIGTGLLDEKYQTAKLPEESEISVMFKGPEAIQSDAEMIANARSKIEAGLSSTVREIMKMNNVEKEQAMEILQEIQDEELLALGRMDGGRPGESQEGSET